MRQFLVEKEIEFDAGHRVPNHRSKCRNPHGHRYRVIVGVVGDLHTDGSDEGMVIDFGDIKERLAVVVHNTYDHGFIVHKDDEPMMAALRVLEVEAGGSMRIIPVDFVPTAENLAKDIYESLKFGLPGLAYAKVFETPTSMAMYPVVVFKTEPVGN